jgi:hypothetical protein
MLELISLTKVKALLGIVGADFDAKLEMFIPIVSSDVRRILNDPMDKWISGSVDSGSDLLRSSEKLTLGTVLYAPELKDDTYIKSIKSSGYLLSSKADDDVKEFVPTISINQWQAIARMIFYRVGNAKPVVAGEKVQSKSMGPVSYSYSLNVNKKWNYPQELIDDLGYPRLKTC